MSENNNAVIPSPTQNPLNSFPAWRLPNGTINASDADLESASSSCGTWEWGCAAVVVVAIIAEFVIAYVHPAYDSALNRFGSLAADAAIAIGIVGEVIFGRLDARIQTELRKRSNKQLADATKTAAEASARAAEALARFEEAKLAILRLGPRIIDQEQFAKMLALASEKFPVEILFSRNDPEAYSLALQIVEGLRRAEWEVRDPQSKTDKELAACVERPKELSEAPPIGVVMVSMRTETPEEYRYFSLAPKLMRIPAPIRPGLIALMYAVGSIRGGGWTSGLQGADPKNLDAPPKGILRVIVGPKR